MKGQKDKMLVQTDRYPEMIDTQYTCPCCSYRVFSEPPGSYQICPICFWEDDPVQLLNPAYAGGANRPSLMECQTNFQRFGACEKCFTKNVRPPAATDSRDIDWRSAQQSDLQFVRRPSDFSKEDDDRLDKWYYWKRLGAEQRDDREL